MRVIAGHYKGHRLFTPKDQQVRPTTDRTREFLFSFIGDKVDGARVLDLFAGTGSVGIEALSRNAAQAVFVDNSSAACDLVKKNLEKIKTNAPVHRMSAKVFIQQISQPFDIVFCDPPYRYPHNSELIELILENDILAPGGWLIYESGYKEDIGPVNGYINIKVKKLGTTKITVLERNES